MSRQLWLDDFSVDGWCRQMTEWASKRSYERPSFAPADCALVLNRLFHAKDLNRLATCIHMLKPMHIRIIDCWSNDSDFLMWFVNCLRNVDNIELSASQHSALDLTQFPSGVKILTVETSPASVFIPGHFGNLNTLSLEGCSLSCGDFMPLCRLQQLVLDHITFAGDIKLNPNLSVVLLRHTSVNGVVFSPGAKMTYVKFCHAQVGTVYKLPATNNLSVVSTAIAAFDPPLAPNCCKVAELHVSDNETGRYLMRTELGVKKLTLNSGHYINLTFMLFPTTTELRIVGRCSETTASADFVALPEHCPDLRRVIIEGAVVLMPAKERHWLHLTINFSVPPVMRAVAKEWGDKYAQGYKSLEDDGDDDEDDNSESPGA